MLRARLMTILGFYALVASSAALIGAQQPGYKPAVAKRDTGLGPRGDNAIFVISGAEVAEEDEE
ncbi:hypothetical protein Hte_008570 [Hypoxylon texense]